MTKKLRERHWTTDNEKRYIDSLWHGTYEREESHQAADPVTLLNNYIKSARRRIQWGTFGTVNGYEVVAYAESLLQGHSL